jgi:hypothetical protein
MGLQTCGATPTYLNRFAYFDHRGKPLPRPLIIIVLGALAALTAGFLMFGGANMGH